MRLINARRLARAPYTFEFKEWPENGLPKYAILSHRWLMDNQEVLYKELVDRETFHREQTHQKAGWIKIQRAASIAVDYGYEWVWCDTCCIDKTSSSELSESINSMFRWYQESSLCIAYLADYPCKVRIFTESEWFQRAWTFQELIAPVKLVFFDCNWDHLFNDYLKAQKHELSEEIVQRTRIDPTVLQDPRQLNWFSIAQKMSWAAGRQAQKVEDIAYSLLGIFDVSMPMLYGEGSKAFLRLQEEIMKRNPDQSVLVWTNSATQSLLATCPDDYEACSDFRMDRSARKPFTLNNLGLDITLSLRMIGFNTYMAPLGVEGPQGPGSLAHLLLEIDGDGGELCRVGSISVASLQDEFHTLTERTRPVTILRSHMQREKASMNALYGFRLGSNCLPLTVVNKWDPHHVWDQGVWGRWDLTTVSPVSPVQQVLKRAAQRRQTFDEYGMGNAFLHETVAEPPSFVYSDKASATVAMMTLVLDEKNKFLIQLSFDFDFNPCCHVSRYIHDFYERFRERNWNTPAEDKRLNWSFQEHNWDTNLRSQTARIEDASTGRSAWVAKSLRRQKFAEQIPPNITKPYQGLEVRFNYHDEYTREWVFSVRSPNMDLPAIRDYVGDQFAIRDVQAGTCDREPQVMIDV